MGCSSEDGEKGEKWDKEVSGVGARGDRGKKGTMLVEDGCLGYSEGRTPEEAG